MRKFVFIILLTLNLSACISKTQTASSSKGQTTIVQTITAIPTTSSAHQPTTTTTPSITPTATSIPSETPTPVPYTSTPIALSRVPNNVKLTETARLGKGMVTDLAWSPDKRKLAVSTSIGIYLFDTETMEVASFIDTGSWISDLSYLQNDVIYAWGSYNTVLIWDARDSTLSRIPLEIEYKWDSIATAFSPDGTLVATGAYDGKIRIWSLRDGNLIHILEGGQSYIYDLEFSPDGLILASGDDSGGVRLWNVYDGSLLQRLDECFGRAIAFSPDGSILASAYGFNIFLWNVADNYMVRVLPTGFGFAMTDLSFSRDGKLLVMGNESNVNLQVFNLSDGRLIHILRENSSGYTLSSEFSLDGRLLASCNSEGSFLMWDVSTGGSLPRVEGFLGEIKSVLYSPDGKLLVTGSQDQSVRTWRVPDISLLRIQEGYTWETEFMSFSSDGQLLSVGNDYRESNLVFGGVVNIWEINNEKILQRVAERLYTYTIVAFSLDGTMLAITPNIWSVIDGTLLDTLEDGGDALAFSLDGTKLATASTETLNLWSIADGSLLYSLDVEQYVISLAFSPDEDVFAVGLGGGTMQLRNVDDGELLQEWTEIDHYVENVAFSPDGMIIVSVSVFVFDPYGPPALNDYSIRFWNVSDGSLLGTLEGHTSIVNSVAFSPDGKILATGSDDGTVRFWEVP